MHPTRLLLLDFVPAIGVGGILLALPVSSTGKAVPVIDAWLAVFRCPIVPFLNRNGGRLLWELKINGMKVA